MDLIYGFIIYFVVLILGVLGFMIRKWITIGLVILFKRKSLIFVINNDRRLVPYTVKIDDRRINIDNSLYFIEPKRVNFLSLLKRKKLPNPLPNNPVEKKMSWDEFRKKNVDLLKEKDGMKLMGERWREYNKKNPNNPGNPLPTYNVNLQKLNFFGNTPVYIYREGNPEPLDLYALSKLYEQKGKGKKIKSIITGRYLSDFYAKIQSAKQIELFDRLKPYMWVIIIVVLMFAAAITYFVIAGLVPQIAASSGANVAKIIPV